MFKYNINLFIQDNKQYIESDFKKKTEQYIYRIKTECLLTLTALHIFLIFFINMNILFIITHKYY
jgi:hypothetical protein